MRGGVERASNGQRVGVRRRARPRGHLQLRRLHRRVGVGGGGRGRGGGLLRLVLLHHLQVEAVHLIARWLTESIQELLENITDMLDGRLEIRATDAIGESLQE